MLTMHDDEVFLYVLGNEITHDRFLCMSLVVLSMSLRQESSAQNPGRIYDS